MITKEKREEFVNKICEHVHDAQENRADHTLIYSEKIKNQFRNEFILFIKPGITLKNEKIKLSEIVTLVFDKIEEFGLSVKMIKVLPGKYLEKYNIMANHYGVINKLSVNVREEISETGKDKFRQVFGIRFEDADIYGGHEFLKAFPGFTPFALSVLWQNTGFQKLTSGTYAGKFTFDGCDYYLVNGFHPRQLNHFYMDGRSVVVVALSGDLDWAKARNDFIGVTDPSKANNGSLRHEFLIKQEALGIPLMNTAYNGVHLSAGPVEALNELIRFNSDYRDKNKILKIEDFITGRMLLDSFSRDQINKILENKKVEHDGHFYNAFDLTEEKNTDEIVDILKKYY